MPTGPVFAYRTLIRRLQKTPISFARSSTLAFQTVRHGSTNVNSQLAECWAWPCLLTVANAGMVVVLADLRWWNGTRRRAKWAQIAYHTWHGVRTRICRGPNGCRAHRRRSTLTKMVVPLLEFVFVVLGSVVITLLVLALIWPRLRDVRQLVAIEVATIAGIVVWNFALDATNASSLNIDTALLGLSVQDLGSGVLAGLATLLTLLAIVKIAPVSRAVGIAAIVAAVTILVDRFG